MNRTTLASISLLAAVSLVACGSSSDGDGAAAGDVGSAGSAGSQNQAGAAGTGGTEAGGGAGAGGCLDPLAQPLLVPMTDAAAVGVTTPMVVDGGTLFYGDQGHTLYAAPLAGGAPVAVFQPPDLAWLSGRFWVRQDDIVVDADGKLSSIPKTGGAPTQLATLAIKSVAVEVQGDFAYLVNQNTSSAPYAVEYVKKDLTSGAETVLLATELPEQPSRQLVVAADGLFTLRGKQLVKIALSGSGEAAVDLGFAPAQLYLSGFADAKVYVSAMTPPDASSIIGTGHFGRVPAAGGAFEQGFESSKGIFGAGLVARTGAGVAHFNVKNLYHWKDGGSAELVACFRTETDSANGVTYHGFAAAAGNAYIGVRLIKNGSTKNGILAVPLP